MSKEEKLVKDIVLLERSIEEKWVPIYLGGKTDNGVDNCPLCEEYYKNGGVCSDCPVKEDTCETMCRGTPYTKNWGVVAGVGHYADTPERKTAALKEINYLQELEGRLAREKKKVQEKPKVFYPYIFYLTLLERIKTPEKRQLLKSMIKELLEREGVRIEYITYNCSDRPLNLNPKTGIWS